MRSHSRGVINFACLGGRSYQSPCERVNSKRLLEVHWQAFWTKRSRHGYDSQGITQRRVFTRPEPLVPKCELTCQWHAPFAKVVTTISIKVICSKFVIAPLQSARHGECFCFRLQRTPFPLFLPSPPPPQPHTPTPLYQPHPPKRRGEVQVAGESVSMLLFVEAHMHAAPTAPVGQQHSEFRGFDDHWQCFETLECGVCLSFQCRVQCTVRL